MSENIDSDCMLLPFTENDSVGFLSLKNLLYPDHPSSLESFCHHEKTRTEKIQHKHWVWEKDGAILCSTLYTQWEEIYHPNKFIIKIYVNPDLQGRGYGAFCYDFIIKKLEPLDPVKITSEVNEIHVRGIRFLEDRGFITP